MLLGCTEKPAAVTKQAGTFNLEQGTYYTEKGTMSVASWGASDKAGMFLAGQDKTYSASPIMTGDKKSLFLFSLEASSADEVTAVAFYPADMALNLEGGKVKVDIPVEQDGKVSPCMFGKVRGKASSFKDKDLALRHIHTTMMVHIRMGNYMISELELKSNGNEGIAGEVVLDIDNMKTTASSSNISMKFKTPLDCTKSSQTAALTVAAGTLAKGYTLTLTTTEGEKITSTVEEAVTFASGGKYESGEASSTDQTQLYVCGDNMVYLIDPELANESGYKEAVLWSWDAKDAAEKIGITAANAIRLDDCKPIDMGKKLLMTSSKGYCVLLDVKTKDVLFYCNYAPNAHSAEILPNNRLVVACSESTQNGKEVGQKLLLYDIAQSNKIIQEVPCANAHGVVWSEKYQRLYALGYDSKGFIDVYKLTGWETASPKLSFEKRINTPTGGTHDLTLVNENTLCVAGINAYLYSIEANSFTELKHFNGTTAMKSLNYNYETGECWYTDATWEHRDNPTWSPKSVCYVTSCDAVSVTKKIAIPDIILYKVRVLNW